MHTVSWKCADAIQPNNTNLPLRSRFNTTYDMKQGLYTYPTWPESLDESLYVKPRPIPKMITAEYDRRLALTAMLRAKHGNIEEEEDYWVVKILLLKRLHLCYFSSLSPY